MELCDNGHDVVCYTSRFCPVCEREEQITSLEREIEDLKDKIEEMKEA